MYVFEYTHGMAHVWMSEENLWDSFFQCGPLELNSGHHACQQAPLHTEPSSLTFLSYLLRGFFFRDNYSLISWFLFLSFVDVLGNDFLGLVSGSVSSHLLECFLNN